MKNKSNLSQLLNNKIIIFSPKSKNYHLKINHLKINYSPKEKHYDKLNLISWIFLSKIKIITNSCTIPTTPTTIITSISEEISLLTDSIKEPKIKNGSASQN